MLNRIEWAKQVGGRMPPDFNAVAATDAGMGPLVSAGTKIAMARAETQGDALALLLSSPNSSAGDEMQSRPPYAP